MTISAQLKQLLQDFSDWAKPFKAQVAIAADLDDLINRLKETPGAPRIVLMFHREEKRGQYEESGMVDRYFWVAIANGKGLTADPAARLTEGQAGGPALYDVADSARDQVRKTSFAAATTEVTPDYKSMEPLSVNNNTLTDVLRIEFSIGVQLPSAQ